MSGKEGRKVRVKMLIAALAAAVVAGVAGTTSVATAGPSSGLKITPAAVNFGPVAVDSSVTKTVTITNKTGYTLTYTGAHWPNFDNPVVGPGYDYGFWQVGSFDSCLTLAPGTSCTADFQFKPFEQGNFSTYFQVWYTDGVGSYSDSIPMWGTGIAPTD